MARQKPVVLREEQPGYFYWTYTDSREGQSGSGFTKYTASFKEQHRAVTPEWHAMLGNKHFVAQPLPYTVTWGNYSAGSVSLRMKYPWYNPDMAWLVHWTSQPFYWERPWDLPGVRGKAIKKLASMMPGKTSVNLPVAYAERKQTFDTVISGVDRLLTAARALKRGQVTKAANALGVSPKPALTRAARRRGLRGRKTMARVPETSALDSMADRWLDLQYGWMPILSDIQGAAEACSKAYRDRQNIETFTASASATYKAPIHYKSAFWPYEQLDAGEVFSRAQCRVSVTVAPDDDACRILRTTGITNPGLVAWELVPYSFVVDWFIPVGDYLEQLAAFDGLMFRSGFISQKITVEGYPSVNFNRSNFMGEGSYIGINGSASFSEGYFRREILGGFPLPDLPSFRNPVSPSHIATASALLNQLRKVLTS